MMKVFKFFGKMTIFINEIISSKQYGTLMKNEVAIHIHGQKISIEKILKLKFYENITNIIDID